MAQRPTARDDGVARGALIVIAAGDERYTIGDGYYSFAQGTKHRLTLFRVQKAAGEGITAAGGPLEVLLDAQSVTITMSGTPGTRTIARPGAWKATDPATPAKRVNGTCRIDNTGSDPLTVTLTSATWEPAFVSDKLALVGTTLVIVVAMPLLRRRTDSQPPAQKNANQRNATVMNSKFSRGGFAALGCSSHLPSS